MSISELKDGFIEIPHRADLALRVWSSDWMGIFLQSALGLYALMGIKKNSEMIKSRKINLMGVDDETLLISFLNELINEAVLRRVIYHDFKIHIHEFHLEGELKGAAIKTFAREIKAATYHNIKLRRTQSGFETRIVFDV
jgi:SHS2 domain-containing protein